MARTVSLATLEQLRQRGQIEETVDTAHAAALLGLVPQTLRNWSSDGDGPIRPRRVNGRLRWSLAELAKLINGEPLTAATAPAAESSNPPNPAAAASGTAAPEHVPRVTPRRRSAGRRSGP